MAAGLAFAAMLAAGAAQAMGGSPKPPPLPGACEVLKSIDTKDVLGATPSFKLNNDIKNDQGRLTTCIGHAAAGDGQVTLLLRASAKAPKQDAAALRKAFVDSVNAAADTPLTTENEAIGAAAVWTEEDHQLTVWTHRGQVMMVLSGRGGADRTALEAIAKKIAAAYP
jgi:hypothetical protein